MRNSNTAWMLRQDGKAFPVKVHLYAMGDPDLSSEAEVAAFLISTDSKDIKLAEEVLDIWMALLIENKVFYDDDADDINQRIREEVSSLPFKFQYMLPIDKFISIHEQCNNYDDVDSLYSYIDLSMERLKELQEDIKQSLNQQFCRVRYGGRTNSTGEFSGPTGSLWFRISSVGFNWVDVIYIFTSNNYRRLKVQSIFICRDFESDNGDDYSKPDYFYKAKDGQLYYNMPLEEYLEEEHEHSPVFSSKMNVTINPCKGVISCARQLLSVGETYSQAREYLKGHGIILSSFTWQKLLASDRKQCIDASEWYDNAGTRTKVKIMKMVQMIQRSYSFISNIDVDVIPRENNTGNPIGFEMTCTIESEEIPEINGLQIQIVHKKPLNTIPIDILVRDFKREYSDFCNFKGIKF